MQDPSRPRPNGMQVIRTTTMIAESTLWVQMVAASHQQEGRVPGGDGWHSSRCPDEVGGKNGFGFGEVA